jgi:hypothetical protein
MKKLPWPQLESDIVPGAVAARHIQDDDEPVTVAYQIRGHGMYAGVIVFSNENWYDKKDDWNTYKEFYYYMPISSNRQEIEEEVRTILDLLRAGGVAVSDSVELFLGA